MSTGYLLIIAGPFRFLLDAQTILEILPASNLEEVEKEANLGRFIIWRDTPIQLIDSRKLLNINSPPEKNYSDIICRYDHEQLPIAFRIDKALRLTQLQDKDFHPLPPLPAPLPEIFDKTYVNAQGVLSLRFRIPLPMDRILENNR
ncbi:chemotaxis protein CheW [Magnetococcales bacterium HHB-1]